MNLTSTDRTHAAKLAMKLQGIPYIWGGSSPQLGFDCSGFVIWILQVFGLLPAGDWTADSMSKLLRPTGTPQPGDLVFYGHDTTSISHVMMYLGEQDTIGKVVIGASGGDSHCTNPEEARKRGAQVKIKPMFYRRDFQFVGDISTIDISD